MTYNLFLGLGTIKKDQEAGRIFEVPEALAGEDEEFSLGSYGEPFLADAYSAFRITRIRWATDADSDPATGTVRCAEFEFEHHWPLFADPAWQFGIRLQGDGTFDRWLAGARAEGHAIQSYSWTPEATR
ncbi:hypothetical protein [Kitasatospora cinereorecta]|uniref:Uncharacterized protein n=1 Tax=Kitasatospora cinereorecta TaxID=285560 RepID=A0ABW0VDS8_9ACTN